MYSESFIPKLRSDLESIPTKSGKEPALVIRDRLGLIGEAVLVQGDGLTLLNLIDGRRTLRDIQVALIRQRGGIMVTLESIARLVGDLDEAFLLESDHFLREKRRILDEFRRLDVRPAALAGRSYPADKTALRLYLDSVLSRGKGGPPQRPLGAVEGLVAPHIDIEEGARIYARAYGAIRHLSPDTIIVLGTGHDIDAGFFSLTEKDFETPLGRLRTDKKFMHRLWTAGGDAVSPSDIAHRKEHSLEFQIVFLQRLFGTAFTLVPLLCGGFTEAFDRASSLSAIPGVREVLALLKSYRQERRSSALVVAGVDFSHIGPKFGHDRTARALLEETRNHDLKLIDALCRSDSAAFWAESRRVDDRFNVCGFSALAVLLEILPDAKGYFLDYDVWHDEPTRSAVTFAALVFGQGSCVSAKNSI